MPVYQKAIQKYTLNNYNIKSVIYLNGDIRYKPLLKIEKKSNMNMTMFLSVSEKKNKY